MKITVLGCGTSGGVPRIGNDWGACDPSNPRNRRRRVSVLVEDQGKKLIVDTSPDLREQLLSADISDLDGVLYTHDHADHTHGIDDLRGVFQNTRQRTDTYGSQHTMEVLRGRFGYIFEGKNGYPATCNSNIIEAHTPLNIKGINVLPFEQLHGKITSFGYRFGKFAYSTDVSELSDFAFKMLEGVEVWLVDALRYEPHPTHSHLERTLSWIDRVKPKQAFLTHMTWDLDYETLCKDLPDHIRPAFDGMEINL